MKPIAFFMVLLLFHSVLISLHALRDAEYEVLDETVSITRLSDAVLSVEIGENTYLLGCEDVRYYANEATTDGEHFIVFGYVHDRRAPTFYDAFIFITDVEGDILYHDILDFGDLEETVDLILVEDTWMFRINKSTHDTHDYIRTATFFLVFNDDFTSYETARVDAYVHRMHIIHGALYLSDTHLPHFHTFVTPELDVYAEGAIAGFPHDDDATDVIELRMIGPALLDGVVHEHYIRIEAAGHYTLVYDGDVYSITLNPWIAGVEDGGVYTGDIIIALSSGTGYLNGDLLAYGETVSCVGHHTLRVTGKNGYEKHIGFTIESGLSGLEDGGVYEATVTPFFAGEGTLNGNALQSGSEIAEIGLHTLVINGTNGYEETVSFEITPASANGVANTLMIVEIVLISSAVVLIGVFVFFGIRKASLKRM